MLNDIEQKLFELRLKLNCYDCELIAFRINKNETTFWFFDSNECQEFSICSNEKFNDMGSYFEKKMFIELEEMGYVK